MLRNSIIGTKTVWCGWWTPCYCLISRPKGAMGMRHHCTVYNPNCKPLQLNISRLTCLQTQQGTEGGWAVVSTEVVTLEFCQWWSAKSSGLPSMHVTCTSSVLLWAKLWWPSVLSVVYRHSNRQTKIAEHSENYCEPCYGGLEYCPWCRDTATGKRRLQNTLRIIVSQTMVA